MRISLKELRESERWLKLIRRAELRSNELTVADLINETDPLIRIFVTSIATAKKHRK